MRNLFLFLISMVAIALTLFIDLKSEALAQNEGADNEWLAQRSVQQAKASFRYDQALPRIINGVPVYEHRFWACIEVLEINFSIAPVLSTLMGNVTISGTGGNQRAMTPVKVSPDGHVVNFRLAGENACNDWNRANSVVIGQGVRFMSGQTLSSFSESKFLLPWPPSVNALPASRLTKLILNSTTETYFKVIDNNIHQVEINPENQITTLTRSPSAVSDAWKEQLNWRQRVHLQPIYQQQSITPFPMGTDFSEASAYSIPNQYASSDLIYVLHQTGIFMTKLFPERAPIKLADMSNGRGETPSINSGSGIIYRHPPGSHIKGQDVDIPYLYKDNGSIDWESNFWLAYSLLESTGTDMFITAYKNEFIAIARQVYEAGLINHIALARFDSARVTQDSGLGHDDHFHVSVRNGDDNGVSRKFSLADSVFNCYLKLKPAGRGAGGNFCVQ